MPPTRAPLVAFDELSDAGRVRRYRRLAQRALDDYGLHVTRLIPVREGECMIFRVGSAEGRFALRIHNPGYQDRTSVESELHWLGVLRAADLSVPQPRPTRTGSLLTVASVPGIDGERVCDVLLWQDGRLSSSRTPPARYRAMGVLLGALHSRAESFRPPAWFKRQRWDGDHVFGHPMDRAREAVAPYLDAADLGIVDRVIDDDRAARANIGTAPEVFAMIHADLTLGNVLFHRGQARAIDFDDCGFGHLLYDVAVALSRPRLQPGYPHIKAALLEGYRAVRDLPLEHERHLDALVAARRFSLMAWQVLRWNEPYGLNGYLSEMRALVHDPDVSVGG